MDMTPWKMGRMKTDTGPGRDTPRFPKPAPQGHEPKIPSQEAVTLIFMPNGKVKLVKGGGTQSVCREEAILPLIRV
jgi:hypothetical protein